MISFEILIILAIDQSAVGVWRYTNPLYDWKKCKRPIDCRIVINVIDKSALESDNEPISSRIVFHVHVIDQSAVGVWQ